MRFACDTCHTRYTLADEKVRGRVLKIRCKNCKAVMVVRDPALERTPGAADAAGEATRVVPAGEAVRLPRDAEPAARTWENLATRTIPAAEAMRLARSSAAVEPPDPIWYALRQGEQLGPMPREELAARVAAGELGPRTYVWREGMADWQRLQTVEELADLLAPARDEAPTRLAPIYDAITPGPASFGAPTPGPAAAAPQPTPPPAEAPLEARSGGLDADALFGPDPAAPEPTPVLPARPAPHPVAGTWSPASSAAPPMVGPAGKRSGGGRVARLIGAGILLAALIAAAAHWLLPAGGAEAAPRPNAHAPAEAR